MNNTFMLSYTPGSTLLHRIDPRVKIFSLIAGLSAILLAAAWAAFLPMMVIALTTTMAAQSTLGQIWRDFFSFSVFYLMTIVIHILLVSPQIIQNPAAIAVGLNTGLFFAAKIALTAIFISPIFRTSHPLQFADLLTSKHRRLPRLTRALNRLGFVLQTTMRFLPLILKEIDRIRTVHKCRGLVLKGGLHQRIVKLPAFMIPIIDSALRRSETVSMAMTARGFTLDAPRSRHAPLVFSKVDLFASVLVTACIALIFII